MSLNPILMSLNPFFNGDNDWKWLYNVSSTFISIFVSLFSNENNFFLSKTHSFAIDESYLPAKQESTYLKESYDLEADDDLYIENQEKISVFKINK